MVMRHISFNQVASSEELSELSIRLQYSMVIVRTVNGLVDASQQGVFAESVLSLAHRINLPGWIVELRHDATHNEMPSISVLRAAASQLLSWLFDYYWNPQHLYIEHLIVLSKLMTNLSMEASTQDTSTGSCDSSNSNDLAVNNNEVIQPTSVSPEPRAAATARTPSKKRPSDAPLSYAKLKRALSNKSGNSSPPLSVKVSETSTSVATPTPAVTNVNTAIPVTISEPTDNTPITDKMVYVLNIFQQLYDRLLQMSRGLDISNNNNDSNNNSNDTTTSTLHSKKMNRDTYNRLLKRLYNDIFKLLQLQCIITHTFITQFFVPELLNSMHEITQLKSSNISNNQTDISSSNDGNAILSLLDSTCDQILPFEYMIYCMLLLNYKFSVQFIGTDSDAVSNRIYGGSEGAITYSITSSSNSYRSLVNIITITLWENLHDQWLSTFSNLLNGLSDCGTDDLPVSNSNHILQEQLIQSKTQISTTNDYIAKVLSVIFDKIESMKGNFIDFVMREVISDNAKQQNSSDSSTSSSVTFSNHTKAAETTSQLLHVLYDNCIGKRGLRGIGTNILSYNGNETTNKRWTNEFPQDLCRHFALRDEWRGYIQKSLSNLIVGVQNTTQSLSTHVSTAPHTTELINQCQETLMESEKRMQELANSIVR